MDIRLVMRNFAAHDGELSTCALAFFLLISFIPLSLVIISTLSFFYNSDDMAALYLNLLRNRIPTVNIEELARIINNIVYKKRYLAFIWIPFLFWWGSFIFDIIERGLEKAFHIGESRKYWKAKIRHFIIIIGIAFFVFVMTFISNVIAILKNSGIGTLINSNLNELAAFPQFLDFLRRVPLFFSAATTLLINTVLVFIIYRFIPPRKLSDSSLFKGALFASLSYEVVKTLFSYYITEFNDYSSIFGSLNTLVILMIWIWYTCFLFIFGAEMAWVFYERKEKKTLSDQ